MSSNNSNKRLEIKNISYISTYNLSKACNMNKISSDNKRLLTGFKSETNKTNNNSNHMRNNSNSTNKNVSKQGKRNKNKKSLNESPNLRLTSPKFLTNNNFHKNKGSSTPSVSPLMFSLSQTSKNKKNKVNPKGGINLIANLEKFNGTGKAKEKNIIKNIYTTKLDNNFLLNKYFCKSVGKDTQNFISKRNFAGISLNQGNKSENSHEKNNTNTKNDIKNNNYIIIQNNNKNINNNINNSNNTNQNMNTNKSNQSNSNITNKRNPTNNNGNGLFSSTSTNSINNILNKNVNNIKTVNLVGTNNNNNKNHKVNYKNKSGNKRAIKTKSAEQTAHNPNFFKNELVYNTSYIINFFQSKNVKKIKSKDIIEKKHQKKENKENKNSKNQNKVLNIQNKLNNNSDNISSVNKEKSYVSTTTTNNNISTTAGNVINNMNSNVKKMNYSDINNEELNLEELHFFMVNNIQEYKKNELDF